MALAFRYKALKLFQLVPLHVCPSCFRAQSEELPTLIGFNPNATAVIWP